MKLDPNWRPLNPRFVAVLWICGLGACTESSSPNEPVPSSGIQFVDVNTAIDLTPDGRIALLEDLASADGNLYFYNTVTQDLKLKTTVGSPLRDFATAISSDGRVSALHADPVQAGLWTEAGGWLDLGSEYSTGCDQDISGGWDISANGHVVVGLDWNNCVAQAFRWSDASGTAVFTPLEVLGASAPGSDDAPNNRATVVSDDGTIAAGWAQSEIVDRRPVLWAENGDGTVIDAGGVFPDDAPGEVLSISADGKVVAGIWNLDGFFWSKGTGVVDIGRLATALPSDPSYPNAIAAGGQLIFGACGDPFLSLPAAFVWTAGDGMRSLQDIAVAAGVTIPEGFLLANVLAASSDGTVVLGQAFDDTGAQVSFVLRLPVSAYGL